MTEVPRFPRFSGGFKTFTVREYNNHEKGTEGRLRVYSQGSRDKVVEFLWLKFVWDSLSKMEYRLLLTLPETINSDRKLAFLKAILLFPKSVIRKRLMKRELQLGIKVSSRERYRGYSSRLDVEIYVEQRRLPKVPKYSGYVASPSSVGTKSQRGTGIPEPTSDTEFSLENEIILNWYGLLTVEDNDLFSGIVLNLPDES